MAVTVSTDRRHLLKGKRVDTQLLPLTDHSLALAAGLIKQGQVVAFPTETVYGLGGDGLNPQAVRRIFAAKHRPADNPLILHIHSISQLNGLCHFTKTAETLAQAFWPGPLTMLLQKTDRVPNATTAGLPSVAIRMPGHEGALRFLKACSSPIAAPSANRSGRPSPTSARHVWDDLNGLIPLILDGGPSEVGVESTVLDITGDSPTILRPGAVTPEQVAMVLGECALAESLMRPLREGETALSPGMKHRHYAPMGRLTLVSGSPEAVAEKIRALYDREPGARILAMRENIGRYGDRQVSDLGKDAAEAAHNLFYLLRRFDDEKVQRIYSECLPATGLGLAVMNRLSRAAEFDRIDAGV